MNRVHTAFEEIFDKALQLGGTITGEHGVGLAKKPFLAKAVGLENIRLMQSLKKVVDPKNIMNPGKVIDLQD
jgi:glycolate oxidase